MVIKLLSQTSNLLFSTVLCNIEGLEPYKSHFFSIWLPVRLCQKGTLERHWKTEGGNREILLQLSINLHSGNSNGSSISNWFQLAIFCFCVFPIIPRLVLPSLLKYLFFLSRQQLLRILGFSSSEPLFKLLNSNNPNLFSLFSQS